MPLRIVIDACVLYPTVMREVVLGAARAGAFIPLWSDRILEEWARAARKLGDLGEVQARAEVALLRTSWPCACVNWDDTALDQLWLPDADDRHVLAAAIAGEASSIMTLNARDFPTSVLGGHGLTRVDPDAFLYDYWQADPAPMTRVATQVLKEARRLSGDDWQMRALLRKCRLPRLAKALG